MNKIKKEHNKYLVLKKSELIILLSQENRTFLNIIVSMLNKKKKNLIRLKLCKGKLNNKYIVCNQDEPYAKKVWQNILEGETNKKNKNKKNKNKKARRKKKTCKTCEHYWYCLHTMFLDCSTNPEKIKLNKKKK